MATYYNGNSEIQGGDGLQTLILMNPRYVNYSGAEQPSAFLNSDHHHAPPPPPSQTHQFVGIPLSAPPPPQSSVHSQHDISAVHGFVPRVQYMYNPAEMAAPPRDVTRFQQGLSLSLSSQQPRFGSHAAGVPAGDDGTGPRAGAGGPTSSASGISNGVESVLLNSKYLKATQELLEEVVNVGKEVYTNQDQSSKNLKTVGSGGGSPAATTGEGLNGEESGGKRGGDVELTTSEKQEIQMKKAKLINILDEVEQRYRQYHHQMQIVISWFEQAAGMGSARTYTALALQTISKQFRCLKDAIMGQIKVAGKSLGEDSFGGGGGRSDGGSRLRFVDNQLRQQRALQQLGMIQHNAWRPQRGLPERSVSVLRAWLFEHFLHPYPKDSDKHLLAKQTGLTRSQVSNWFINARVRLWKPMVEEMYMEEIKEQEHNGCDDNKTSNNEQNEGNSNSSYKNGKSLSSDNSNLGFKSTKPPETSINHHPPPPSTTTEINFQNPTDFTESCRGYPVGEIGQFSTDQFQPQYSVNGVSLTLGLPHCDNRGFVANQNDEFGVINQSSSSHSEAMYESMNIRNRKRFAAQLLPDFVA